MSAREGLLGSTMLTGPGMKASASFTASSDTDEAAKKISSLSAMCTIRGLSEGLPFALKIDDTASAFVASAPRPYTVSVGNTTIPPRVMAEAAWLMPRSY